MQKTSLPLQLFLLLRCVLHKPLHEATTTPFDSFSRALLGVIFYDDAWNIKRENTIHGVQRKAIPVRIPRKDIVNHDDLTTCFRKNGSILDGVVGDRRVSNAGHTDRCAYVIETHRFEKQLYVSVYDYGGTRLSYINQTHTHKCIGTEQQRTQNCRSSLQQQVNERTRTPKTYFRPS